MNKNTVRSVISVILSFLMTLAITLLLVLVCLRLTIFNKDYIPSRINEAYYTTALNTLTEKLKTFAEPSMMPEETFDNLFTADMIKEDLKEAMKDTLSGLDYSFDDTAVHKLLMDRFTQYAERSGIKTDSANLESLTSLCIQEYKKQISIPFLQTYAPIRNMFDNFFVVALLILSGVLIGILLLLFFIHPYKHRAVRFTIYSLLASALMIIPIPLFVLLQGAYEKWQIEPAQVQALVTSMVRTTMLSLLTGGIFVGIVGVLLLFLVRHMRDSLLQKHI